MPAITAVVSATFKAEAMSAASPPGSTGRRRFVCFHPCESGVVVRELVDVGESDLSSDQRVVVGHVCGEIGATVLQLDVHSRSKLFDIEWGGVPIDPELLSNALRFFCGEGHPCHASTRASAPTRAASSTSRFE